MTLHTCHVNFGSPFYYKDGEHIHLTITPLFRHGLATLRAFGGASTAVCNKGDRQNYEEQLGAGAKGWQVSWLESFALKQVALFT